MSPDLSVIIVNWNTCDLLRDCLTSVEAGLTTRTAQVIVVDNASGDGSVEMVRASFPRAEVLVNARNTGYAEANNRGLALARGRVIILLNPDTVVLERALERLADYLERHPDVGAVGPALVLPDGSLPVVNAGYQPTLARMAAHAFLLWRLFPRSRALRGIHLPSDDSRQPREVEWLSGACLVVRHEVVEQVGPLAERWFMYAEDLEWCDRMLRAGWRLTYLPGIRVMHYGGASVHRGPPRFASLWAYSLLDYYARRCRASRLERAACGGLFAAGWLLRAAGRLAQGAATARPGKRTRWRQAGMALRYAVVGLRFATGRAEAPRR